MTVKTKSSFLYNYIVDANNFYLNFSEGATEFTATIPPRNYSFTSLASALAVALNSVGSLNYSVTPSRSNRTYTISATGNFELLAATGSNAGSSIYSLIGLNATDLSGASSYTSVNTTGTIYEPQFTLQEFVGFEDFQEFAESKVNQSASGVVEIYSIGTRQFMEFNIKFANNGITKNSVSFDANGIENLREFMRYAITKGDIEFMKDSANVNSFDTIILERTPTESNGTGYKLQPMRGNVGEDFYQTGILKFRKKV